MDKIELQRLYHSIENGKHSLSTSDDDITISSTKEKHHIIEKGYV
jgi:hypothetical protein